MAAAAPAGAWPYPLRAAVRGSPWAAGPRAYPASVPPSHPAASPPTGAGRVAAFKGGEWEGELPCVGVFDSGIGGLSVVAAMQELQPNVPVSYVADNGFFPYGDRSQESIRQRVLEVGSQLVGEGCCMLVVACNTACSAALEELRASVGVPVVGVEPPLKPAVLGSTSKRVIVLATRSTAGGARLARLTEAWGSGGALRRPFPNPPLAGQLFRAPCLL
eukprot:CAMPEP_0182874068 /NCGR_PEP_ID=MMETSP0034_2-20130328/12715_1 /TAXON_ID=156128 /ORGANISM="Nephroselmis pyriformis, Strain CCMP717" /LENGTH=217 /DNA_ID=CAMNT_0025006763 /DNA_START=1 /DNA_END=651 /DNA_ORIENTATION=-